MPQAGIAAAPEEQDEPLPGELLCRVSVELEPWRRTFVHVSVSGVLIRRHSAQETHQSCDFLWVSIFNT